MQNFFHMPNYLSRVVVVLALGFLLASAHAQKITRAPEMSQPLAQRWAWAEQQASKQFAGEEVWIGYSIEQMMPSRSFIGNLTIVDDCIQRKGKSLSELLNNVPAPDSLPCGKKMRHAEDRQMLKEIGFFFRVKGRAGDFRKFEMSTFSLSVDFRHAPILWLGRASQSESINHLEKLYHASTNAHNKEEVIAAVGTHAAAVERKTFLQSVLASREGSSVRKQAVFYMGENADAETVKLLKQTAERDRSEEVCKQAVFALTLTKNAETSEALAALVKSASSAEVRKDALFWLGQTQSEVAVRTLRDALQTGDLEMQKQALFVITQLPKKEGVELLIDAAQHHAHAEVRKEALFWLAQQNSEQAAPVIKRALDQDDFQVQQQAVFALTQLPRAEGIPVLVEIARTHADPKIRKDAMFWLGQSDDPRATEALIKIARGQ